MLTKIFLILLGFSIHAESGVLNHNLVSTLAFEKYLNGLSNEEVKQIETLIKRERIREFLPRVGLQFFNLRNQNQNQADTKYDEYRIYIQQLLYDGGEFLRLKEIISLSTKIEYEDRKLRLKRNLRDLNKNYFSCLANQSRKFLSLKNYNKITYLNKIVIKENKLAMKRKIDILDASIKLDDAESMLNKSNLQLLECKVELEKSMDLGWDDFDFEENILSDFDIHFPSDRDLKVEDNPEVKKAKYILDKAKNESELSENYWKPKIYVGGYYAKNSTDAFVNRHPNYGVDFTFVLPLGSSNLQSSGRYGIQEDGNGIQRIPGFGPQYVGTGENSYNSSGLQLFDNMSVSRKIIEGEIRSKEAKRNLQEVLSKTDMEYLKVKNKLKFAYETYKKSYRKVLFKIENNRIANLNYKANQISKWEHYLAEYETYKSLIDLSESISEYLSLVQEWMILSGDNDNQAYYIYKKNSAHRELFTFLKEAENE